MMRQEPPAGEFPFSAMVVAGGAVTVCGMPLLLTGAMSAQVSQDLAFGAGALGVAAGAYRLSTAISAVPFGNLTDRLGAGRALIWSVSLTATVALLIALTARSWTTMLVLLGVAGFATALVQPAANRYLLAFVSRSRLGVGFGIKQASLPIASLIAGASVPAIAMTIGWRYAFAIPAVIALGVIAGIRSLRERRLRLPDATVGTLEKGVTRLRHPGTVVLMSVALGFANAATLSAPVFFVDSAVRSDVVAGTAGVLLSVASFFAIAVRVLSGLIADRLRDHHLVMCAALLVTGAGGFMLLSVADSVVAIGIGGIIALGCAWGYNGVFWYTIVAAYPDAPGRVTGAMQPGGLAGGILGPLVFGLLAESRGYPVAWFFGGSMVLTSAVVMVFGSALLRKNRRNVG